MTWEELITDMQHKMALDHRLASMPVKFLSGSESEDVYELGVEISTQGEEIDAINQYVDEEGHTNWVLTP